MKNLKNLKPEPRLTLIRGVLALDFPHDYDEYEYFYSWLNYADLSLNEDWTFKVLSDEEISLVEKIKELMEERYKAFLETKIFTEAMWQEIHKAQQEFLNLPSIKKDIAKL